jgi:hypothetical protein
MLESDNDEAAVDDAGTNAPRRQGADIAIGDMLAPAVHGLAYSKMRAELPTR